MASLLVIPEAFSQDSGMMDIESSDTERDRIDREKIISSPGEGDVRYIGKSTVTTTKDSAVSSRIVAPSKVKSEKASASSKPVMEKQGKNSQDDSILSFNFLYYIIEKYKLQDIVD